MKVLLRYSTDPHQKNGPQAWFHPHLALFEICQHLHPELTELLIKGSTIPSPSDSHCDLVRQKC